MPDKINVNLGFEFGYLAKRFFVKEKLEESKDMPFDINHIAELKYKNNEDQKFLSKFSEIVSKIIKPLLNT